ncbi:component of the Tol biopolymer transport system [Fodinibius roseus]|uniref:Component of the Tol biopolymer transport system n=1 Tax=Fodinibius roseus TaxID=1194090 RepID=A0A1M5CUB7_9BACT|nr:BamA/TamA family outer membrane protein [Fodinibius roseus]SHF58350.1 component of the Tol biopolymer transport system [Fodinibius roseus]
MEKSQLLSRFLTGLFAMVFVAGAVHEASAQYFSFGKNRVQYDTFDWRYIQSEHFDVYYYTSGNYDLANFTATSLEAALRQFHEDFDHQIADRIQVIIYDSHNDFAQTNVIPLPAGAEGIGGATDAYKNRITMPFQGDFTQFRSTLHHELEHAVINDMFYGGNVQSRLGGNALQIPLWFNEGMAEYTSLGWDTETDMWIRDAIINDYLPPIPRLGGYFAYRGGQSVWNYIVEEYGRQKITEIMQTMKTQRSVEAAFTRTTGYNIEELTDQWRDFYRKRYLPEVANREKIDDFAELVTERGKFGTYNTSPSVSPQGDKIAMITNARGYFDVVVVSALTGEKLKTLIKGEDNVNFEELNILNPNLSWSPQGDKIALSSKSKGNDNLAIVDYNTGKVQLIQFPRLDAIGSVAWAPDGNKIAFDGNIGPYQDIYVYNLQTEEFSNVTNDVISDYEPAWGADSETIYFVSSRGDEVNLNRVKNTSSLLLTDDLYSTDIYSVKLGASRAERLTITPRWNENQPITTRDGELFFISDENGIPNVYQMNLSDRTTSPLTDLQTGVMQMSVSADGSRLAVNTINEGALDIFMVRAPLTRKKDQPLEPNQWAQRRAQETEAERVPATQYVREMLLSKPLGQSSLSEDAVNNVLEREPKLAVVDTIKTDTTASEVAQADTDTTSEGEESEEIDFRNYVFDSSVEEDTVFAAKYLDKSKFDLEGNRTDDGRYIPRDYRLKFSTDLVYAGGSFSTYYGTYGLTQIVFSDLLGNHQIAFGSNLNFDLRNSSYFLQYGYMEKRTNWIFNFFHNASNFQDFSGRLYRFRSYGGAVNMQYPIDKFRRIDVGLSAIGLAQDFSVAFSDQTQNETSTFLYPQITYTSDRTLPGYITPVGGSRYSVSLTASPPITSETPQFASVLGDYRKYFNLGSRYSFALRGSGAASFGSDSQTYFMGGMLGWINQKWSNNSLPLERLGDTFFTLPALPLRGHPYNATYGDKFSLINAEFRFPLFAAILPGPIPILPLYNLTGVAFWDTGMAWGQDVVFDYNDLQGNSRSAVLNSGDLDFKVSERGERTFSTSTGEHTVRVNNGDILMGAGFGLRTIVFGFPLRYDVGWPFYRGGFDSDPIHYVTIGIDF